MITIYHFSLLSKEFFLNMERNFDTPDMSCVGREVEKIGDRRTVMNTSKSEIKPTKKNTKIKQRVK